MPVDLVSDANRKPAMKQRRHTDNLEAWNVRRVVPVDWHAETVEMLQLADCEYIGTLLIRRNAPWMVISFDPHRRPRPERIRILSVTELALQSGACTPGCPAELRGADLVMEKSIVETTMRKSISTRKHGQGVRLGVSSVKRKAPGKWQMLLTLSETQVFCNSAIQSSKQGMRQIRSPWQVIVRCAVQTP